MKKTLLITLLLVPCSAAFAQWTSFTNFNYVSQMAFQPGGSIIWGATPGGMFSFSSTDTFLLKHYTNVDGLPYIECSSITLDIRQNKWVGTLGGGLARLDSAGDDWTVFSRDDGLASDTVLCAAASGQYIFAGGYGSLSYYDGYNWFSLLSQQGYKLGNQTQALAVRDDSLWIATDQGLYVVSMSPLAAIRDTANWETFASYGGLSFDIRCLLLVDTMSVIGAINGAARLVGGLWQSIPGLSLPVRSLALAGDSLLLATNNGVKLWHQNVLSDISAGLTSLNVLSLSVDVAGQLWAGCNDGIHRRSDGLWKGFAFSQIPSNYVRQVAVSKNNTLWASDGNNLAFNYRNGVWRSFANPKPGIPFASLTTDQQNNAWLGLAWWDGLNNSYIVKFSNDSMLNIYSTPQVPQKCGVWAAYTNSGNYKYFSAYNFAIFLVSPDDSVWTTYVDPSPRGAYSNAMWIISIAEDLLGGLWLGSYYNDLTYFNPQKNTWEHFGIESGIPDVNVRQIAIDKTNTVWLATGNGLCRSEYDPLTHTLKSNIYHTDNSPILGNDIRTIAIDRSDNKWIGTDRGLSLLTWEGKWINYERQNSCLLSNDIQHIAACPHDQSGDYIYIATAKGLSLFSYDDVAQRDVAQAYVAPNPLDLTQGDIIYLSNLPSEARIDFYTLDGRPCGTFHGPPAPAHTLAIRPQTDFSLPPASGIYLCRIQSSGQKAIILKLVIVR